MLQYPDINPVALSLGPLQIHWYGITYLLGFTGAWLLAKRRAGKPDSGWNNEQVSDLIFYGALGVILGGRIGYMLFYKFSGLMAEPLSLFRVWEGGMSFHGGFIGVIVALFVFAKSNNKTGFEILDFIAPMVPVGLGAGRIGNFIGGELWGRVTDAPWGMVFPGAGALPRHPSQLYQCALEGIALFTILWLYSAKPKPTFAVAGMFSLWYGIFRFIVEFFRQPDSGINFIAFNWLTMGQLLSLPMIIAGLVVLFLAYKKNAFGEQS